MLTEDLIQALSGLMIATCYQPIVRLSDRRPLALEALARLNHPTRGTLLPEHFVPLIEQAGLAARLSEVVAAIAFQDLASPALAALRLQVTLNFPPHVLTFAEALDRLDDQCHEAGIRADQVMIELTEGLRGDGYLVAIDDVGLDVPGIEGLLSLPVNGIKLDKGLVMGQGSSPALRGFLERTVEAALLRGLWIVAEGVENPASWHWLRGLGVDCAQGFLIARPMACGAVPLWLETWSHQDDFK
jgi:EAL domain-containing protein (putative c-di-GMP-specific phosphodiesterase class I)